MKRFRQFTFAIVALCFTALVGYGLVKQFTAASPWKAVTIVYETYRTDPTGNRRLAGRDIHLHKENGEWMEKQTLFDAQGNEKSCGDLYADVTGVWRVRHEDRTAYRLGEWLPLPLTEENLRRAQATKDGTEVLGYRTNEREQDLGRGVTVRSQYAPDLNGWPMRRIETHPDGSSSERVAVSVEYGPVEFKKRPRDYRVISDRKQE